MRCSRTFHALVHGQAASDRAGGARAGRARGVLRRVALPDPREVREHAVAHAAGGAARRDRAPTGARERDGDSSDVGAAVATLPDGELLGRRARRTATAVCLYNDRGDDRRRATTSARTRSSRCRTACCTATARSSACGTARGSTAARARCAAVRRSSRSPSFETRVEDGSHPRRRQRATTWSRTHDARAIRAARDFPLLAAQPGAALPRLRGDVAEAARRARRDARVLRDATTRTRTAARTRCRRARPTAYHDARERDRAVPRRRRRGLPDLHARHHRGAEPRGDGVGTRQRREPATRSSSRRSSTTPTSSRGSSSRSRAARRFRICRADERPARRPRRAARAGRPAHEGRRVQPRVERARHDQPGAPRSRRSRGRVGRAGGVRRRAGRAAPAASASTRSTWTSTRSAATRCAARWGSAA